MVKGKLTAGEGKTASSWSADEVRSNFDEFLEAIASSGPHTIVDGEREFSIRLIRAPDTKVANAFLVAGGPLENN